MSVKNILLRRRGKVEVEESKNGEIYENAAYVASINANIQSLGYSLSEDLFNALEKKDVEYLTRFNEWLVPELQKSVGANVKYKPMYPNFPNQVMKMDEVELYINAIKHYWNRNYHNAGYGEIFEEVETKLEKRLPLNEKNKKLKNIELGNKEDRIQIFDNLMKSSVAYSEQDREDVLEFIKEEGIKKHIPEKIGNKENLAYLMSEVLDISRFLPENFNELNNKEKNEQKRKAMNKAIKEAYKLKPHVKNATDVLRIYAGLCDGDISLSKPTKYKALPRKERRFLLSLFEDTNDLGTYMSMKPEEFKKAFQYLHVDEYKDEEGNPLYIKTSKAINKIRESEYEKTFLGKVQAEIESGNIEEVTKLLVKEPGIFARKLDEVLRLTDKKEPILEQFSKVANKVDPKILLTLKEHFKVRTEDRDYRIFFPKGRTAKGFIKNNDLEPISEELSQNINQICDEALIDIYKDKGDLGKVYISEELKRFKAPLVLRNLSKGSKAITRGSRIPVDDDKNVLRAFIWWKDDIDNDLSAVLFDDDWNYKSRISYTNLKNRYGCHSGDITYQRNNGVYGECEFIDMDINKAREKDVRYIVFEVHNFSGLKFDESNCKFGYMEREEMFKRSSGYDQIYPNTEEIFEPLTVKNVMDLTANTSSMVPFIFDTKTREIIWGDIAISGNFRLNNVESTLPNAVAACYSCVNNESPNLYDMLALNAKARGEIIENKEEADEIFALDEGITPFDHDIIVARFLGSNKDEQCKEVRERTEKTDEFEKEVLKCANKKKELEEKQEKAEDLLKSYEQENLSKVEDLDEK